MRTSALAKPPLGPTPRTIVTWRTVARLDRSAAATLHVCWWVLNALLVAVVSVVLWFERAHRTVARPEPIGWCKNQNGYSSDFRCMWCGTLTREGECIQLTCCAMEIDRAIEKDT